MNRKVLFVLLTLIASVIIGAFFSFPRVGQKEVLATSPELSELESKALSGADILSVIADTRALLKQKNLSRLELLKAQKRLDAATDEFYRKHLRQIAESLAVKNGADTYKPSFENATKNELKAETSTRYLETLEKKLNDSENIDISSDLFRTYVYVAGKTMGQPSSVGTIPKETMAVMLKAEKGATLPESSILDEKTLKETFQELGFYPWSGTDLRTMRKAIAIEGLSSQTRYVKAYVSAWHYFGKGAGTTRLYLKESLKHEKQKQSLSCEANSVADYLNFYRLRTGSGRVTEHEVFSLLPKDERLPELVKENGKNMRIWWDPNAVFVGKANGKQSVNINQLTGYGIHPSGVLPMVEWELDKLGFEAKISTVNPFNILWSIYSGEPVLFWYVLSDNPKKGFSKLEWKTWEGADRVWYVGEHTGIIVGAEVSKNGDLLKLAYYEWTNEAIHWDNAEDVLRKAGYFNEAIYAVRK